MRDGQIVFPYIDSSAARFDSHELLSPDGPGIYFIFIFARNVCMNVQTKSARLMRDTLARNANKDGIFSGIVCLLSIRD